MVFSRHFDALKVYLLFNKHVMIEELLESLIRVIDQKLFQNVEIENLESGDVQNADEELLRVRSFQRLVHFRYLFGKVSNDIMQMRFWKSVLD